MPFKIFRNKLYKSHLEAERDIPIERIYYSQDYFEKNYKKLEKIKNKNTFYVYEYSFIKFIYSILLEKDNNKQFSILDYGGGLGNTILELIKKEYFHKNLRVSLYDSNYDLVKTAKLFFNKYIDKKYLKKIYFLKKINKKQNFDAIHFGSMFEHVFDEYKFFDELFASIKRKPKHIFFSDVFITKNQREFYCIGRYYGQSYIVKFHTLKDLIKIMSSYKYNLIDQKLYLPNINGQYRFYDMSNLPKKNRIFNTMNLHFKKI